MEIAIVAGADETLHPYVCSWDGVLCGTDSDGMCEGKEIMINTMRMFETLGLSEANIEAMDWIEVTRILGESPCIQIAVMDLNNEKGFDICVGSPILYARDSVDLTAILRNLNDTAPMLRSIKEIASNRPVWIDGDCFGQYW